MSDTLPVWLHTKGEDLILEILVQPRASRSKVVGEHDGRLKIQLASPPVDGKANAALQKMLAHLLHIPRSAIVLSHGESGRRKRIRIEGSDVATVLRVLNDQTGPG